MALNEKLLRKDRLEQLATMLEQNETAKGMMFDMNFFHHVNDYDAYEKAGDHNEEHPDDLHYCGTAGCIGGWVCVMFPSPSGRNGFGEYSAALRLAVNLTDVGDAEDELRILFYPELETGASWNWITRSVAAEATREFIATGTVDWSALRDKHKPTERAYDDAGNSTN